MDNSPILIECLIEADDWPDPAGLEQLAETAVSAAMTELQLADTGPSELSIVFSDDRRIQKLNKNWRGQDKPTNVLSFPALDIQPKTTPGPLLGDIILAFETIGDEARLENKPLNHHLTHLIVHGFLHLLGYDHQTENQGREMEALERRILHRLAIPDPYEERQGCD